MSLPVTSRSECLGVKRRNSSTLPGWLRLVGTFGLHYLCKCNDDNLGKKFPASSPLEDRSASGQCFATTAEQGELGASSAPIKYEGWGFQNYGCATY